MTPVAPGLWQDWRARLGDWSPRLRFAPDLEQRFWQTTAAARLRHFVASGLVALLTYNCFLVVDWIMAPDVLTLALCLRLALFTPACAAVLLIGARRPAFVLRHSPIATEWVVVATGLTAALTLDVILSSTRSPLGALYRSGFVPVLVYGNLAQRLRFRSAAVLSVAVVGIYASSFATMRAQAEVFHPLEWPMTLMLLAVAAYTLLSNYRMEYVERQRFLANERTRDLSHQLQASHERLDAQARSDALTGVANRRHFDTYLNRSWERQRTSGRPLSLLLIDIDHFKAFNDRYGHPAGDECLRHVARALQAQVPEAIGLLARWGGEEFAVVLPDFTAADATTIAWALRDAVRSQSLRHESSPTAPTVTISVGVASVLPQDCLFGPAQLVEAADAALYRAKHAGRNRVACAMPDDLVWP